MGRHLIIAGIDRYSELIGNSLVIEAVLTSQIDSVSFMIKGEKPNEGDSVVIEDDAIGRLFAGVIDKVELADYSPDKTVKVWKCEAQDDTYTLDKRLVVETYSNMAADLIVKDILVKYCPGFSSAGVQSGAPIIDYLPIDYKRPSEALKEICDWTGWEFYVDYYKVVHFFNPANLAQPAPMSLEPGGYFRNVKHSIETTGLRNRVYVRGGTMLSDPWTYEVKADGSARAWVLPHKPHDITVKVGGVTKTCGIENVHEESQYDFLMNFQEKYVRCSAQTPTPAQGVTLSFTYRYDIDVITMVEDIASQQAIAAVQGGDGVYEHVIVDDSLTTIDAAEAAGMADLREHANPRVKGSFETEVSGWAPGQLVTINLPDRGITGTFLVQKVTIVPTTPELWTYRVEYGGRLLGIADWLQALWKAQQKKKLNETALLHKFHYGAETAKVTDEVQGTLRTPPWKVEQGLEVDLDASFYSKTETTQADFQAGTLTNVVATAAGDLELGLDDYIDDFSSDTWSKSATGAFTVTYTGSSYQITFPSSTASSAGQYGQVSKTIPIVNKGNIRLQVDVTDTYTGPTSGYHFKQVLVDGVVVWEDDVAGDEGTIRVDVDISAQVSGKSQITVVLRVYDKQGVSNFDVTVTWDNFRLTNVRYKPIGSRLSPVYDISPVGTAASGTISWNATLPANTSLTVETNLSLDGGVTWQGWQAVTNGGAIPGITEGTDLSKAQLQIRQTLSTADATVTPQLHDVTVVIRPLVQFATVGSLLLVWQPGSEAWAQPQYRTSTDGITWSAWQGVDPVQRGAIEVPYPGYVRLKANGRVQARNWKKPFDQTDVVCGFVMAAS